MKEAFYDWLLTSFYCKEYSYLMFPSFIIVDIFCKKSVIALKFSKIYKMAKLILFGEKYR